MKLAVVGAGAWGTALAVALSANYPVSLWCRSATQAAALRRDNENKQYLPGVQLGDAVSVVDDLELGLESAELALFAVPTAALRETLRSAGECMGDTGCVWACKGFESGTGKLPHEVAAEELLRDQVLRLMWRGDCRQR
jgi:glycerol-3-phosphate dehydrogenase (NAD(P)+)